MPTVLINSKQVKLAPKAVLGKGGEADVYKWRKLAVKLWKQPNHPDLANNPAEQAAARQRLRQHQDKMPQYPTGLPSRVVVPRDLVRDQKGRIVGYTMRLVPDAEVLMSYGQRRFRQNVPTTQVVEIFKDLATTVRQLHRHGVVIGDFNDLNEMVRTTAAGAPEVYLIDADSFQFGKFKCNAFTTKFLDPLLCQDALQLNKPHNKNSDWYSYAVMLLQSLLFCGPYGGVYRPKNPQDRCTQDQRPLRRISIFNPEVRYPKFAVPWAALSDDLLDTFQKIFTKDQRGTFPLPTLERARWTHCGTCGIDHARRACPCCSAAAPVQQLIKEVKGNLTCTVLLHTQDTIVRVETNGKTQWVQYHAGQFTRDNKTILVGTRQPKQRFRILGDETIMGDGSGVVTVLPSQDKLLVDNTPQGTPALDTNSKAVYWCSNGTLYWRAARQAAGQAGERPVGQVLQGRTRFWVGERFGLGYYRAGEMAVAFVFGAERQGIMDQVELPCLRGRLLGARCYFAGDLCWLLVAVKRGSTIVHHCSVVDSKGLVRAVEEQPENEPGWLSSIHGKVAAGNQLYCSTDDGLVRVDLTRHGAEQTRTFPDTEPYCQEGDELLLGQGGIVVIKTKEILLLEMK